MYKRQLAEEDVALVKLSIQFNFIISTLTYGGESMKGLDIRRMEVVEFEPSNPFTFATIGGKNINIDMEKKVLFLSEEKYPFEFSKMREPDRIEYSQITIYPTLKCNMKCAYCYAECPQDRELDPKILEKFFDFIAPYSSPNPGVIVFGGEPTLNMELLKKIRELSEEYFISPKLALSTNGILAQKKRELLLDICDVICITYEGTPELMKKWRPSDIPDYVKIVEESIKFFSEKMTNFEVRVTLTEDKLNKIDEIVENLCRIGVKKAQVAMIHGMGRGICYMKTRREITHRMVEKFIELVEKLMDHGIDCSKANIKNALTPEPFHLKCGAGYHRISLGVDGSLGACSGWYARDLLKKDRRMRPFYIGEVSKNGGKFFWEKVERLIKERYKSLSVCRTCPMYPLCGACPLMEKIEGKKVVIDKTLCEEAFKVVQKLYIYLIRKFLQDNNLKSR